MQKSVATYAVDDVAHAPASPKCAGPFEGLATVDAPGRVQST
ncbi:MAG: hypothetical protein HLUCCO17_16290 [Saliniramus fredricksonii]|uniref:Uncharacterized protein n=1 Tax=Saliniramus fredricksonii TaxID=1653334 RepID=A0A0P7XXB1_9HYPH|nr:hypothetical protein [Saliniramus fredricksonii]KPQ09099.1 MAG: hypothetical protein HLUCCO17_16290 [Saliniramus fredricksonii]SCC81634.1 hypothetical protein GA0071312_2589 [Saliniramus fredricksonii]